MDGARHQRLNHLRTTAKRHRLVLDAGGLAELGKTDMFSAANERNTPVQRSFLGSGDNILNGLQLPLATYRDECRVVHGASHADQVVDCYRRFAPGDGVKVGLRQGNQRVTVPGAFCRERMRLGSGTAALPDHAHIHPEDAARADHHHPGRGVRSTAILRVDDHVDGLGRKLFLRRHGRHPGNT